LLPKESYFRNSLLFLVLAKPKVLAIDIGFYPAIFGIEEINVSSPCTIPSLLVFFGENIILSVFTG